MLESSASGLMSIERAGRRASVALAMAGDTFVASHARIDACTSWACSGVAVLPVPMAQTGS